MRLFVQASSDAFALTGDTPTAKLQAVASSIEDNTMGHSRTTRRRPQVECLEDRWLPSFGPVQVAVDGHFWEFRGQKVLPVGDSITQGWMELGANFNQTAYVDALAARGINVLMLWTFIGVTDQAADERIGYDAPELWPWPRAGGRFDLTRFNDAYFARLRSLVEYADSKDILVVLTVHDGWTKTRFAGHPLYAVLGGSLTDRAQYVELHNYTGEMPAAFDPGWSRQQKNQFYLERFCDRLIQATGDLPNVVYEMFNEGEWYNQANLLAFQRHFLDFFRARTARPLLINDDHVDGPDIDFRTDPRAGAISLHSPRWDTEPPATTFFDAFRGHFVGAPAKPFFFSEPVPEYQGDATRHDGLRWLLWGSAIGGAGVVIQNDTSWGFDPNTLMAAQAANRDIVLNYEGHAARFFNASGVNLNGLVPDGSLCSTGVCMASPGREYVVYAPSGTTFTVNLSAAAQPFSARFYNPRSGAFRSAFLVTGGASAQAFTKPDGNDWVLHLRLRPGGSTLTLTATADSYVQQSASTTNYGTDPELRLRDGVAHASGGGWRETLVRFNPSSIPAGAMIASAVLRLNTTLIYNANTDSGVRAYRITGSWSETGVTYGNRPGHAAAPESATPVTSTGWKSWDVTNLVRSWLSGTQTNHGIKLRAELGGWLSFGSRESANRPQLLVTLSTPLTTPLIVTGADAGGEPRVRAYDASTGVLVYDFLPFPSTFTGGVRVALGDVTGDGIPDLIAGTGPGAPAQVRIFDGASLDLIPAPVAGPFGSLFPYGPAFTGGLFMASADLSGDGRADLVITPDSGLDPATSQAPPLTVFDAATGAMLAGGQVYGPSFAGGVRVATGDVNGDGRVDLVTAPGAGLPALVLAVSGADGSLLHVLLPYDVGFTGGAFVAAGDLTGDGRADIVVSPGSGTLPGTGVAPPLVAFSGADGGVLGFGWLFELTFTGGTRAALADVNGDGRADLIAVPGPGRPAQVLAISGTDLSLMRCLLPFGSGFSGGAFVAASGVNAGRVGRGAGTPPLATFPVSEPCAVEDGRPDRWSSHRQA